MNPTTFINKILGIVKTLKGPLVIILLTVSIIQIGYASFIGSDDQRGIYGRIGTLILIASLLFASEGIVEFLQTHFK